MNGNGVRYIEKISDMYGIEDAIKADLLSIVDKIDEQLEPWCWEDIEYAIDFFYTKKSDRNYPKVVQVRAILNANRHDKRSNFNAQRDFYEKGVVMPSTKIRAISDVFLSVCRIAHKEGILCSDYFTLNEGLEFGNKTYVKDGRLCSKRWDWDDMLEDAKHRFPDTFGMFKNLTLMEQFAFAYKLGTLKIGE